MSNPVAPDGVEPRMTHTLTRRQYLTFKALEGGCPTMLVAEAVASLALAHPEWDMGEERTWDEWETAA